MAGENRPDRPSRKGISRKNLLRAAVAAPPAAMLMGGAAPALARNRGRTDQPLAPTPQCSDGDDPTPPQMEGPYFKPDSPRRTSLLEPGDSPPLTVSGFVFDRGCRPLPGVLLDFWQATSAAPTTAWDTATAATSTPTSAAPSSC